MKKFSRQPPTGQSLGVKLNLRAAAAQAPRVFQAGEYRLRVDAARLARSVAGNALACLTIAEPETDRLVDLTPLLIDSPTTHLTALVAKNQLLLAQLFALVGVETNREIDIGIEIEKLVGIVFGGRLVAVPDNRSGRLVNVLDAILEGEAL